MSDYKHRLNLPRTDFPMKASLSQREPERIKQIFLSTCTDLGRDRTFQGHGLLDLMRAIQSV